MKCICGKEISQSAYTCPHCGKRFTPSSAILLGILLPLAGLALIAYSCHVATLP